MATRTFTPEQKARRTEAMRRFRARMTPAQRKEIVRKQYEYKMLKKFGITINQYNTMLELQGGGCAICGKSAADNGKALAVDHNHSTGLVRGILCSRCNLVLDLFESDPNYAQKVECYLDSPPFNLIGASDGN